MKKNRLTQKLKLILIFTSLVLTIAIIAVVSIYLMNKMSSNIETKDKVSRAMSKSFKIKNAESNFLLVDVQDTNFYATGKTQNTLFLDTAYADVKKSLTDLKNLSLVSDDAIQKKIDELVLAYNADSKAFDEICKAQLKRGYLKYGLEGELRKSIHAVETLIKEQSKNKDLTISILDLRRNEKDFLLRKNKASIDKFKLEFENMLNLVDANVDKDGKSDLINLLNQYNSSFFNYTEVTFSIYGDGVKKGMLEKMDATKNVEPIIRDVQNIVEVNIKNAQIQFISMFVIFVVILIILTAFLAIWIVRTLTKSIEKTKKVIHYVAQGDLDFEMPKFGNDEFGDIAIELGVMNEGLKTKSDFASNIGNGNLNIEFIPVSEKDKLGYSLIEMQESLQNAASEDVVRKKEDELRNWATTGAAKFGEILRQNNDDMHLLSFNIIRNLVEYTGMNQGGVFVLNDSDKLNSYLDLTACYAYSRQKFLQKTIQIGEGLVGACFQEGETIYLTDVPNNYVEITSGLGEANPSCILIVPLKLNGQIFGILEMASFRKLEKHEIEFVEKIGESIASTISSVKVNVKTAELLEISQQQAAEMRAQEEEMRQNLEEMHATQEELQRKEAMTQNMVEKMRTQESELKESLSAMTEKEKYTQDLIETMKQQEEELRQNMEEITATQEELGRKDIIQQEEISRLRAENETILEKTMSKEFELQKKIEELQNKLTGNNAATFASSDDVLMDWSDSVFSVDIKLIDDQHKVLLKLINELYGSFRKGQAKDKMGTIIDELVNYTSYHFGVEEKYFSDFNYSDTPAHLHQHVKFVDAILKFKNEFTSGKAAVSYEVLNFLKDWLINHIQVTDKAYVSCFKEHGVR